MRYLFTVFSLFIILVSYTLAQRTFQKGSEYCWHKKSNSPHSFILGDSPNSPKHKFDVLNYKIWMDIRRMVGIRTELDKNADYLFNTMPIKSNVLISADFVSVDDDNGRIVVPCSQGQLLCLYFAAQHELMLQELNNGVNNETY